MSKQWTVARTCRKKHFDWVEFKSIASFKKALDRDALDLACCGNMSFYHHGNERSWSLPPSLFQLSSRRELWCVSPVIDCDSGVQWMKTNRTAVHFLNNVLIARSREFTSTSCTDSCLRQTRSAITASAAWCVCYFIPISFQTKLLSFKKQICVSLHMKYSLTANAACKCLIVAQLPSLKA